MEEKRNCKIVQDLLPNYIEKLTNEETNKFVEEHLNECNNCKQILSNMEKDLKLNIKKKDNREVKYIKKYSNKMKILKIILLVIIALFLIRTARNFIIISSLSNKANTYVSSTNYHKKTTNFYDDTLTIADSYYKDGKTVTFLTRITPDISNKVLIYKNGEKTNMYFETNNEKKTAQLDQENDSLTINIVNYLDTNNSLFATLLGSITSNIKTVNCNGKDCYLITNFLSSNLLISKNDGTYIDKETGLMVRSTMSGGSTDTVVDYIHEFNTVSDDIFIEPDISEYEITDND